MDNKLTNEPPAEVSSMVIFLFVVCSFLAGGWWTYLLYTYELPTWRVKVYLILYHLKSFKCNDTCHPYCNSPIQDTQQSRKTLPVANGKQKLISYRNLCEYIHIYIHVV